MKALFSRAKRGLAWVLTLCLLMSGANLGLVSQALAATEASISVVELVAKSYELNEAEKDVLVLLNGGEDIKYNVPEASDNLVTVDTDNKKITAAAYEDWVATEAYIPEADETVTLINGEGTYQFGGNAFSVKVTYVLNKEVAAAKQEELFNAISALQQSVFVTNMVSAQSGSLTVFEAALPEMVTLMTTGATSNYFTEDLKNLVRGLKNEMDANEGKLKLSNMIEEYDAGSKTEYLLTKGTDMQNEVVVLSGKINTFSATLNTLEQISGALVQNKLITEEQAAQIKRINGVVKNLKDGLAEVAADEWTVANKADKTVYGTKYAELDVAVANLGMLTDVTVKNPLKVAETTVQANLAMFNVTVKYVLKTVGETFYHDEVTLTLAKDVTAAEIEAAVAAEGIEAAAIASWGDDYVEGQYVATASELPATLTEDIEYTVTYNPKKYTVTYGWGDPEERLPYGSKITLPEHDDPTKSFDYKVNGVAYAQGAVIVIKGDTTIERTAGKAYTSGSLYGIVADNYGTEKIEAILASGAVKGDEVISYREPSKAELEELVKLSGSKLTVQSYASSYAGLNWEPYKYVVDGTEKFFNGAEEVTIEGDFTTVNVFYRLTMTNYTKDDVQDILDLCVTLVEEAEGQKSVMDRLAGFEGQMSQLNKNMLNGLNGVIGGYSTANGGGLNADPAKNDELVAYFQETIGAIVSKCTEGQALRLNTIIKAYNDPNNGGLTYYYQNDALIRNEIAVLSGYLNDMLDGGDRQGALEKLMAENGYADKVDVLDTLGTKLAEISADLAPVNAAIDTANAAKLSALAKALSAEGSVACAECGSPYVEMGPVIRTAEKFVTVEVKVTAGGKSNTASVTILKGEALTQNQVNGLKQAVTEFTKDYSDAAFYTNDYANGAELDALVGVALEQGETYEYAWTAKEYTVEIDGEDDQTVSVNDLTITLPGHPNAGSGMSYEYTIGTKTANAGIYTFDKADLKTLFVNGVLTITRVEKNTATEQLVKMVNDIDQAMGYKALTLVGENGVYTGINADLTAESMMDFVQAMVLKSGYGYIGLNGEGLIYDAGNNQGMEVCLQTLVDAILADTTFSNETIIDLGAGKGKLVTASLQLGNSASEVQYTDLEFVINMSGLPEQIGSVADALEKAKPYMTFKSTGDALDVELTLPEKVYEVYLTALMVTGNVDLSNMNAVDNQIAFEFLYDYATAIIENPDITLDTFVNTLKKVGVDRDLSGYASYYEYARKAFNENLKFDFLPEQAEIAATATSENLKAAFTKLLGDQADTYLSMIKECKDNGELTATVTASLSNTVQDAEALVIDVEALKAAELKDKTAAYDVVFQSERRTYSLRASTSALESRMAAVSGYSAVVLLNDVTADLSFPAAAILDLNGKTLNGSIQANGKLIIIDSSMGTQDAGTVTGTVTGSDVIVLAGKYPNAAVDAYLLEGYALEGNTVVNKIYTVEETGSTVTYTITADISGIPTYFVAADIAADIILNNFTAASLTVDGNTIYAIDQFGNLFDYVDEIKDRDVVGIANAALECVKVEGLEGFINAILEDVFEFNTTDGYKYRMVTRPWDLNIEHNAADDTLAIGIKPNGTQTKETDLVIKFAGAAKTVIDMAADIVEDGSYAEIDLNGDENTQLKIVNNELALDAAAKGALHINLVDSDDYDAYMSVLKKVLGTKEKAEFDELTVAGVITALKNLQDDGSKANAVLSKLGDLLERLEIDGPNTKLGNWDKDNDGRYEWSKENVSREAEITRRGYTVRVNAAIEEIDLSLKLFKVQGQTPTHEHTWDTGWSHNGTHHWHECTDPACPGVKDEDKDGYGEHIYDDGYDKYCNVCGYERSVGSDDDDDDTSSGGGRVCCHGYHCPTSWYTDLKTSAWYHTYTDFVICNGYMIGVADKLFAPDAVSTRAMIVTTIYRMAGAPAVTGTSGYTDVADGLWYSDAITWATQNGVVNGYGDGTFGPNDAVTREQIATIFYRYANLKKINTNRSADLSKYTDGKDVAAWAKDAMEWAVATGMIKGTSTTEKVLSPHADTTRVTLATLLDRWVGKFGK